MLEMIVRRLGYGVLVLFLMIVFIFVVMRMVPGSAVELQLAEAGAVTEEQIAQKKAELGLDKSVPAQLAEWLGNAVQGDLGTSLWSSRSVTSIIGERIPVTMELSLVSIALAIVVGVPVGVLSAIKRNTWVDNVLRISSIVFLSIPNFWLGLLLITFFSLVMGWVPPLGYSTLFDDPVRNIQQIMLPAVALGLSVSASISRMTRSSLLEVLHADFIRTVRAKGASERVVVFKHALRNSLIAVFTLIGLQIGALLGGTVILESIYSLPGMGSLVAQAVNQRDYPVVQAAVLFYGGVFILVNIFVDVAYGWIDPRIRK
jgi:peptide/nickel transport system permease protein